MRFSTEEPPVFISLIMNVSSHLSNWLKMCKMRCISQINTHYFPFMSYNIEITIFAIWGFVLQKNCTILMETLYTREFTFGKIIHHYLFNSLVYKMVPLYLNRNLQGLLISGIIHLTLIRGRIISGSIS